MKYLFVILSLIATLYSCKKEDSASSSNPFNDPSLKPPADTSKDFLLDSTSFQFLYYKVFEPTCANSGCHDGNFQPDFRTIYSSYNTLVLHDVIQNDAGGSFEYRVKPFEPGKSLLHERLTNFMENTSGIMPLAVEPTSDWLTDSSTYKKLIFEWIKRGAPDSYGNLPGTANQKPQVIGIMAFNSGSTTNPLPRLGPGLSPISMPKGQPVDVWFALADDKTDVANFKLTTLKSSYDLYDFTLAQSYNLSGVGAISGKDFWNNTVSFTHKATLTFPSDTIGTYIFLRTYLMDDEQADTTEVPNNGTSDIMRSYFTLKVDSL
jgi:hypothetical protein